MKRIRLIIIILFFALGMGVAHPGFAYSRAAVPTVGQQTASAQIQSHAAGKYALEMVFVLDTTGSMGGLIDGAKQRDAFVADARRKQPDKKQGFDSAVSEALKRQLARKGIK